MTAQVTTDSELDRVLSFKLSREFPLPPEIVLNGNAADYFRFKLKYDVLGVGRSSIIRLMSDSRFNIGMSQSIDSHADYTERMCHLTSYLGDTPVPFFDLRLFDWSSLDASYYVGYPDNEGCNPSSTEPDGGRGAFAPSPEGSASIGGFR